MQNDSTNKERLPNHQKLNYGYVRKYIREIAGSPRNLQIRATSPPSISLRGHLYQRALSEERL